MNNDTLRSALIVLGTVVVFAIVAYMLDFLLRSLNWELLAKQWYYTERYKTLYIPERLRRST